MNQSSRYTKESMKTSIFLIISVVFAVSLSSCIPPPPQPLFVCGGIAYDNKTYNCVEGYLIIRGSSSSINISSSDTVVSSSSSIIISSSSSSNAICKGIAYNSSTQFCAADNEVYEKCGGKIYSPSAEYCYTNNVLKFGTLTDNRDKNNIKTYKTITIDNKTWMAKDLEYRSGKFVCYNTCEYILYDWETAEKACPAGWRMPSYDDWAHLVSKTGGSNAGKKLKSRSGWNDNGNGTDDYGFGAKPTGHASTGTAVAVYYDVGKTGNWWGGINGARPYKWSISGNSDGIGNIDWNVPGAYFAVRCVKD